MPTCLLMTCVGASVWIQCKSLGKASPKRINGKYTGTGVDSIHLASVMGLRLEAFWEGEGPSLSTPEHIHRSYQPFNTCLQILCPPK